jgi:hypothetical protein
LPVTSNQTYYFKTVYGKELAKIMKPSAGIIKGVINRSTVDSSNLDNEPMNIHFRNGYWSFADHSFKPRMHIHLVTNYINYDFVCPAELDAKKWDEATVAKFNQAYCNLSFPFSSKEAFEYFNYVVASSLLNRPLNNFIALLGNGKNGKTTLTKLLKRVFECYCAEIGVKALDNETEANKSLSEINPNMVFCFGDEPNAEVKKKAHLLKKLSEGNVVYHKLYANGNFKLQTRAKIIMGVNHPLKFDTDDSALKERLLYFKFSKKFSPRQAEVDNVKVFADIPNVELALNDEMKSFMFLVFAFKARSLNSLTPNTIPADVLTQDQLLDWEKFISTHFQLNEKSFVSKKLFCKLFRETYPDFKLTSRQIIKLSMNSQQNGILFTRKETGIKAKEEYFMGYSLH